MSIYVSMTSAMATAGRVVGRRERTARGDARFRRVRMPTHAASLAPRQGPSPDRLDTPRRRCSLYLLEGDGAGELVMHSNVGFRRSVLGRMRLRDRPGITGEAVECMRPIVRTSGRATLRTRSSTSLTRRAFQCYSRCRFTENRARWARWSCSAPERVASSIGARRRGARPSRATIVDRGDPHRRAHRRAARESAWAPQRAACGRGDAKGHAHGAPVVPGLAIGAVAALRRPPQRPAETTRREECRA